VANAILYDTVANVAAIPGSPSNNDAVEVVNSTGIESFSPLSGRPAGFVGDSGLSVRIVYTSSGSTWNWIQYFPNDPEDRYGDAIVTLQGDVTTLQTDLNQAETDILALDTVKLDATTAASTYLTQANAASTYQTQSAMSSYLTTSNAASTYQPQSGMSSYLTTANAASTYQTQAGMSSYVPTSAIGTTVQSYDADTAKTDVAQTFTAAQRGAYVTLTDAATIAPDLSLGNQFQVTLGGNRTLGAPTNVVAGQSGVIRVVQDGTGSRTLAYNSVFKFPGGTALTLTTTANAVDLLVYHVESTTRIAINFIRDVK
jgi:hypothetical protein